MSSASDTIVAPATPPGRGGIAIVRISGDDVEAIAGRMTGGLPEPRLAARRWFTDEAGERIDSGIALYFPKPASFTGESVLELHCHGGPLVVSMLVDAAVALGARRAEPGEFSRRAFENGKLDLAQAEAIADLIASGTSRAARAALRSLSGEFSAAVNALVEELTQLRSHVEAAIDFPEEEIDFLSDDALRRRVEACGEHFRNLLRTASAGRVLTDGFEVVIVGRPNAGKSSLLNLLAGDDAAIVTEVAGTTRDVIRETIDIDGLPIELVDTAGLREDPDRIEAEGIRRARAALERADAVLWIQDASVLGDQAIVEPLPEGVPVTVVRNKIDLSGEPAGILRSAVPVLRLSAKTGEGIEFLRERIRELAGHEEAGAGSFSARRRHVEAIERASRAFARGRQLFLDRRAGELFAEELRAAQASLGEITGEVSADELLGRIFSEFCIGK